MFRLAIMLGLLAGCSHGTTKPSPLPSFSGALPATEDLTAFDQQDADARARTHKDNIDPDGYIGGNRHDGTFSEDGDASLFTCLEMGADGCDQAAPLLDAIAAGIHAYGGMIPRHNPNVPSANGPTSRDMAAGCMLGMVETWRHCPELRAKIHDAWAEHVAYVDATGALGPTADGALLTQRWIWGAVGQYFGAGGGGGSKQEWEAGTVTTAGSVNGAHSACYPVHVGTLEILAAAKIGKPMGDASRGLYCAATRGLGLGLTDWYCERAKAATVLAAYKPDVWFYQWQRCPNWESPDAKGAEEPETDFSLLKRLAGPD